MPIRGELDKYGSLLAKINIKYKKFSDAELAKIKNIFEAGRKEMESDG